MNDDHSEMYHADSGYYDLPTKKPWTCGRTRYKTITLGITLGIGIAGAFLLAPWLFGNARLANTDSSIFGAYYSLFALFPPIILFISCFIGCCRYNRRLFSKRTQNLFSSSDIMYAIQAVFITLLKTALSYCLLALIASPVVFIIGSILAIRWVFKIIK